MSNFLNKISQAFSELTPSHRAVALYISENIDSVAFKTLEELAEDIGVSTTTVIRFAKTMGYDGFSPMQKEIQSEMRNKAALPERLNQSESIPDNEILKRTMANDIKNIELTFSALDDEKTNETVETIESGKKIYVLGMRSAFSLAHYTYSRIAQILANVHLIQGTGMFYPEEIADAGKGDVCIAYLFPRYSKTTANLISYMRKQGVKIILFTSINHSAVNSYGDIIIPCSVRGISYKNTYAAPISVVNYLTAALVSKNMETAKKNLAKAEDILSQGYYLGL